MLCCTFYLQCTIKTTISRQILWDLIFHLIFTISPFLCCHEQCATYIMYTGLNQTKQSNVMESSSIESICFIVNRKHSTALTLVCTIEITIKSKYFYPWLCSFNVPANKTHWNNLSLMLAHRLRRWPNIKPTLFQCVLLALYVTLCLSVTLSTLLSRKIDTDVTMTRCHVACGMSFEPNKHATLIQG